jgi:hypothetical protein
MSESQWFLLEVSSSSDDSNIDELILDDNIEQAMVIVTVKNLQDQMAAVAVCDSVNHSPVGNPKRKV